MKKTLTSILATLPLIAGSCSNKLDQELPEVIALNSYPNLVENYFDARNGNIEITKDIEKFLEDYKPSNATEVEKILIESAYHIEDNSYKTDKNIKSLDGMYNSLDITRKIALYETIKETKQ
tara:strand:- start:117 stop:482 length:366 start_codon:yes stop_codon:yes gene_type:complete